MDSKDLKRYIKMCRENGIKEMELDGLKIVFTDKALEVLGDNPSRKNKRQPKSLPEHHEVLLGKPQAKEILEDSEDLMLTNPYEYERRLEGALDA